MVRLGIPQTLIVRTQLRVGVGMVSALSKTASLNESNTSPLHDFENVEVSVVMPCLNEAETLETCIRKAQHALHEAQINGEVIVADNGSTDGSVEIAENLGARVARISAKGYGSALMGGIAAAAGKFVIMGDADDSYDF